MVSWGIAPRILNLGIRWGKLLASRPVASSPVTAGWEAVWTPETVWTPWRREKILVPTENRTSVVQLITYMNIKAIWFNFKLFGFLKTDFLVYNPMMKLLVPWLNNRRKWTDACETASIGYRWTPSHICICLPPVFHNTNMANFYTCDIGAPLVPFCLGFEVLFSRRFLKAGNCY